jgi:hypothetical protein
MDKARKPSNSVCYTPSSEPYRIKININKKLREDVMRKYLLPFSLEFFFRLLYRNI